MGLGSQNPNISDDFFSSLLVLPPREDAGRQAENNQRDRRRLGHRAALQR
jgi:hypothetical protein